MKAFAAEAARTVGRRLRARGQEAIGARARRGGHAAGPPPASLPASVPLPRADLPPDAGAEPAAEEAELDALRGALVHELDRLASSEGCSASFRRA
jgi:hypothetical protein